MIEKEQLIRLCNILAERILINRYDPEIGTYRIENTIAAGRGEDIPDEHLVAYRLFKEEIMYNWVKYIKLVIKNSYVFAGIMCDEDNLFQQQISEQVWTNIETFIDNFMNLPVWKDRSMSSTIFGGKSNYDFWGTIFSTGKAPDGTVVLANPINVTEMIM